MLEFRMARRAAEPLNRRQLLGCAAASAALGLAAGQRARVRLRHGRVRAGGAADGLTLAGRPVRLLTYNGLFPGPLLRAREGQTLRVRLVNRLDEPTNLHFHGLHVSPADNHDNVFVNVAPAGASPTSSTCRRAMAARSGTTRIATGGSRASSGKGSPDRC